MPSYQPPARNAEYIFYVGLVSQSNTKILQVNPTLATGDVQVSKDGGTLANLGTLPAVTPASSRMVKVTLSASEMDADNVTVVFSDAAGAEWCDLIVNIQPTKQRMLEVNTANFTPTTTRINVLGAGVNSEATADHFIGKVILFESGNLQYQVARITDYAWDGVNSEGELTVTTLTEAPADGDLARLL